jgi:hypothetical protein
MIDIGPRLDSRLRAKFDRIDAEVPPQRLTSFQPSAAQGRHRSLNVIVGVAAIAVVAAAAAAFAVELGGHPRPTPATSSAHGAPLPRMPVYSAPPPPPRVYGPTPMPVYGTGFPASWHIVIPVTQHTGSAVLPAFIPEGWEYIQYACIGAGHLQIVSTDGTFSESFKPCSSSVEPVNAQISGAYGPLSEGRPVILKVVTGPSVRWEIVVAETATPLILPTLPALPANAKVLVPLTYGRGIAALPSFTPHSFQMEWWCSGPGGYQIFVSNGNESEGASTCGGAPSGSGGGLDYAGKRETLVVDVSPHNTWEIRVYWQPNNSSG